MDPPDGGARAVNNPHAVRDVGGLDSRLVQRTDPPEPADVGLADGDEPGHGVHAARRQLGRGIGGPQHHKPDTELLELCAGVHALAGHDGRHDVAE